jgi:uncharacterized protein (TIGR03067 family)
MPSTTEYWAGVINALQGRWKPVYQEVDGEMGPPSVAAATVVEIQGNEFKVLKDGAVAYDGFFTITTPSIPIPPPWDIALVYKNSRNPIFLGGPRPGVFQIEGDTLKWCFTPIGQPPPKGLNTYPGSEAVLSIYQRDPSRARDVASPSVFRGAPLW